MSDDENDLGGFGSNSPLVRAKKSSRAAKPNSRTIEAGPSSKPAKGHKNAPQTITDNSDIEEVVTTINPFDFSRLNGDDTADARTSQAKRGEALPVTNEKANAKGKGKSKVSQIKSASRKPLVEPMDVDPIEVLDETEEEAHGRPQTTAKPNSRVKQNVTRHKEADEIHRLNDKLRRAEAQITALSLQLEELFSTRETEPEKLCRMQQAQFDVQLKGVSHEDVIKELNIQLSMQEPLMRSGNATVLNLLTREAADEEKRNIEQEVQRWKNIAEQKQRDIKQRDERIAMLERTERDLRAELTAEIDRSAALAAKANNRTTPAAARAGGRPGGIDDPKHAEVIRFYEDITNLLIPGLKTSPGLHFGLDEWLMSCIYTFSEDDDDDSQTQKSFNFSLRLYHEVPEGVTQATSKDQLIPTVQFTPQNLDMEPQEYVEKLEFLKDPFSFPRNQLSLFLRTIYQKMKEAIKGDESDDDSVQEIDGP